MNVITTNGACTESSDETIEYGGAVGAALGRPFGETAEEFGAGVGGMTGALIGTARSSLPTDD